MDSIDFGVNGNPLQVSPIIIWHLLNIYIYNKIIKKRRKTIPQLHTCPNWYTNGVPIRDSCIPVFKPLPYWKGRLKIPTPKVLLNLCQKFLWIFKHVLPSTLLIVLPCPRVKFFLQRTFWWSFVLFQSSLIPFYLGVKPSGFLFLTWVCWVVLPCHLSGVNTDVVWLKFSTEQSFFFIIIKRNLGDGFELFFFFPLVFSMWIEYWRSVISGKE